MNEKAKKIVNICIKVFTLMLVVFTVGMMIFTIFSVSTFNKNERSVFGYGFYIVKSDSMSLNEDGSNADYDVHFNAGDIIIAKRFFEEDINGDAKNLQPGEIISFMSRNKDTKGETVTHMIRERVVDDKGNVRNRTFGTHTGETDEVLVEPSDILGTYAGKLPGLGHFFAFLKSTAGYIVCILVPFILLILYNGVNCVLLFRQYKNEQRAQIKAERDEIEAERKQNAEMLKQLQELQAKLNMQNAPPTPGADQGGNTENKSV